MTLQALHYMLGTSVAHAVCENSHRWPRTQVKSLLPHIGSVRRVVMAGMKSREMTISQLFTALHAVVPRFRAGVLTPRTASGQAYALMSQLHVSNHELTIAGSLMRPLAAEHRPSIHEIIVTIVNALTCCPGVDWSGGIAPHADHRGVFGHKIREEHASRH